MQNKVQKYFFNGTIVSLALLLSGTVLVSETQPTYAQPDSGIEATAASVQKSISLQIGSIETEMNITWYADTNVAGKVQVAKKPASGTEFPSTFEEFSATSKVTNDTGFYSNQTTIENLEANTTYVYRVVNDTTISPTYSFTTGDFENGFNFLLAGDPQVGSSKNIPNDTNGWVTSYDGSVAKFSPEFLISAGDQVETASVEEQYTGYLTPSSMKSIPMATTVGNHDSGSAAYAEHFNMPNVSGKGATTAGSDYWYVYNNTLFMDINTNNRSTAEHKAFMEEAIAANPDVTWKTVIFHHSVYSTASHVSDSDIIQRRNELPNVFAELDIDVVLQGHDHVYTRTYMMNGMTPDITDTVESSVTNPTGILYLTANSASGSKYYDLDSEFDTTFAAVKDQSKRKTFTNVEVTDTSYTMTTYFTDDMSELDSFTIYKTDTTALQTAVTESESLVEANYTEASWQPFAQALAEAKTILADTEATQESIDQALLNLVTAKDALVEVETPIAVDKTDLQSKVDEYSTLNAKEYTQASWQVFAQALTNAEEILADTSATQAMVNEALTTLETARDALVLVKAPTNTSSSNQVATGDDTEMMILSIIVVISLLGLIAMEKKSNIEK